MEEIMYQRNNGYIMKYISKGDYYIDIQGTSFRKDDYVLTGKYSPNIIDLIEVGDYVNGHRILEIYEALAPDDERILDIGYGMAIFVEDIKTIVTKELFKNSEYEVKKCKL